MKRALFPLWLASFFLAAVCPRLSAQTPQTNAPQIAFDNKQFDFGRIPVGTIVKHVFIVSNTGTALLEISNVRPGCGCTMCGAWTHEIAPGQTGNIPVEFNSSHFNGSVRKTVEVSSNARNQPRETLALMGTIWKPFDVRPPRVDIPVEAGSTNGGSYTVTIVSQSEKPADVFEPVSSNPSFSATLKTNKPGKEYQLLIHAASAQSGHLSGAITLKTSLPSTPTISVPVSSFSRPPVTVAPPQLMVSTVPGRSTTNRIFITTSNPISLELSDPVCTDPRIKVTIQPAYAHNMFNLLVAFPPDYKIPPGQKVEVSVKTNHPLKPLITVPITEAPKPRAVSVYPRPH